MKLKQLYDYMVDFRNRLSLDGSWEVDEEDHQRLDDVLDALEFIARDERLVSDLEDYLDSDFTEGFAHYGGLTEDEEVKPMQKEIFIVMQEDELEGNMVVSVHSDLETAERVRDMLLDEYTQNYFIDSAKLDDVSYLMLDEE